MFSVTVSEFEKTNGWKILNRNISPFKLGPCLGRCAIAGAHASAHTHTQIHHASCTVVNNYGSKLS